MDYQVVIGLEVHIELATKSKIFCGCTTEFGGEPNTHICPICTGMPGTLPTMNKKVVGYAISTGLAFNCDITRYNKFDRKNYFYPDLPKAYQISQLYLPICRNGRIDIDVNGFSKSIGIHEIHMEEDAGKLLHDEDGNCTLIDYNRCGVPLLEIVSEPDFSTADEVISYLTKVREILMYLGVSDCKMQEGSMRADINISVMPMDSTKLGIRTEMKNMSSFKSIYKAIDYEAKRQIELIEKGGKVIQETRRWDESTDSSFVMRSKENAQDYRYFPEPDLLPIEIDDSMIENIKLNMRELAEVKRDRYIKEYGLSKYDAEVITSARELAYLFEDVTKKCSKPKETCNIIMGELMRLMTQTATTAENLHIDSEKIASLVDLVSSGKINRSVGKEVFEQIFLNNEEPINYVAKKGLLIINDDSLVASAIDEVFTNNRNSLDDYKNGKDKAFGFLVGQTMKALKGRANPQVVNKILMDKLEKILLEL